MAVESSLHSKSLLWGEDLASDFYSKKMNIKFTKLSRACKACPLDFGGGTFALIAPTRLFGVHDEDEEPSHKWAQPG